MNKEEALEFLNKHQLMPNDNTLTEELIDKYDVVRKYFLEYPDKKCIPLFLNSFGEYDGMGVYQLVEDVLLRFSSSDVINYLEESLMSKYNGVRY